MSKKLLHPPVMANQVRPLPMWPGKEFIYSLGQRWPDESPRRRLKTIYTGLVRTPQ
jgi:hypothetical protein